MEDWECCVSIDVQDLIHYSADIPNFPHHLDTVNLPNAMLLCLFLPPSSDLNLRFLWGGPMGPLAFFLDSVLGCFPVGADDSSESDGAAEPLSATVVATRPQSLSSELRNSLQFPPKAFRMVRSTFLRNGPGFIRQGYPIAVVEQSVMNDI